MNRPKFGVLVLCTAVLFLITTDGSDKPGSREFEFEASSFEYPQIARSARVEGQVTATLSLNDKGAVTSVKTHDGHPMLRDAVERQVASWRILLPSRPNSIQLRFRFVLEGAPEYGFSRTKTAFRLPEEVVIQTQPPKVIAD